MKSKIHEPKNQIKMNVSKTITTLLFVIFSFTLSYAQTEEQTLEWLNAKKESIWDSSGTTFDYGGKLEVTGEYIHAYHKNGAYTKLDWKGIKDIKVKENKIVIVSNTMYNGTNSYIKLDMYGSDSGLTDKYLKALKHMAILKGAKLVDDDLF